MTVLCVDLDGTLVNTDTLLETILIYVKSNPFRCLFILYWLLQGRAYLKQQVAKHVNLAVADLPYNAGLLAWIKTEKAKGRKIVLVTATDQKIAHAVANHLNLFDEVLASNGKHNLRSQHKRMMLNDRFGEKQYDYAGNSTVDLPVWSSAHHAIIVNASDNLLKRAKKISQIGECFPAVPFSWRVFFKTLRIHQYIKNVLLFIPLILGHEFYNTDLLINVVIGFISFSLLASSVYILNDLIDLEADRKHHKKRHRGFASGMMSISMGVGLTVGLLLAAILFAYLLPLSFQLILFSYYVMTVLYSFYFKKVPLLDVCLLSGLYTIRILAGVALIHQPYSEWLILFSLFFFTSLAFVKRYTEIMDMPKDNQSTLPGRGYIATDMPLITMFGITSGYLSVLVFALYLNSTKAAHLYYHPKLLFAVCPLLFYWISRIWFLASHAKVHEDPVVFALKDKVTYALAIFVICLGVTASL